MKHIVEKLKHLDNNNYFLVGPQQHPIGFLIELRLQKKTEDHYQKMPIIILLCIIL